MSPPPASYTAASNNGLDYAYSSASWPQPSKGHGQSSGGDWHTVKASLLIGAVAAVVSLLPLRDLLRTYPSLRDIPFLDVVARGLLVAVACYVLRDVLFPMS
jgi:hypothetical protein